MSFPKNDSRISFLYTITWIAQRWQRLLSSLANCALDNRLQEAPKKFGLVKSDSLKLYVVRAIVLARLKILLNQIMINQDFIESWHSTRAS